MPESFESILGTRGRSEVAVAPDPARNPEYQGRLVRVAGLEPALLAETEFESVASTIPPHPQPARPWQDRPTRGPIVTRRDDLPRRAGGVNRD